MNKDNTQTSDARQDGNGNRPTHVAKVRNGYGKKATYERIGVAWRNADGSFYIKLYGTQVVSNFTLYELADAEAAGE